MRRRIDVYIKFTRGIESSNLKGFSILKFRFQDVERYEKGKAVEFFGIWFPDLKIYQKIVSGIRSDHPEVVTDDWLKAIRAWDDLTIKVCSEVIKHGHKTEAISQLIASIPSEIRLLQQEYLALEREHARVVNLSYVNSQTVYSSEFDLIQESYLTPVNSDIDIPISPQYPLYCFSRFK